VTEAIALYDKSVIRNGASTLCTYKGGQRVQFALVR